MKRCSSCGGLNPEDFRYCGSCGRPTDPAAGPRFGDERKVITVVFCDLVGFTAASEKADPEDVRARMQPYFRLARTEFERHGGVVEKFIGDAVVGVFGAPVAREDDPERAVRASLQILEAIEDANNRDPSLNLSVRIGIDTGEAIVALDARPEMGEGIATGDVVNTASRLQGKAPIGGVAVGIGTYLATRHVIDYEELPPAEVSGKAEPVAMFHAKAARSRYGAEPLRGYSTPFVGREREVDLLHAVFTRSLHDRSVQLLTIVGEPGIGKSRLVGELADYIDALQDLVRWRRGRCLAYGDGVTFWALGEIVKAEAGILESDGPDAAVAKLDRALQANDPDREWLRQRLLPLVGIEPPSPAQQEEAFTAWRRFLEHMSTERSTVLVFEDVHWADDALLAFLEHVLDTTVDAPLVLVATGRPELYERHPGWAASARNATRINLAPLSPDEMTTLVAGLLAGADLPGGVQALIAERSGGNPLYAEEYVRLLTERGVLRQDGTAWRVEANADIPLPSGIRALIAARLDSLTPEHKSILADASVIGVAFWSGAIASIGGTDSRSVERALDELAHKEFVRRTRTSTMKGETEYAFGNTLTKEVAYAQIPRVARAEKHLAAAAWIESAAPDRLEDFAEILASHNGQAMELLLATGDRDRAAALREPTLRYELLAGDRAMAFNIARAEAHYRRSLELTEPDHQLRAEVLARLAATVQLGGELAEAAALYEQALATYADSGRSGDAADVALRLSVVFDAQGERAQSRALVDQVIDTLRPQGPSPQLARAFAERAYPDWSDGPEAIEWADQALQLADQLGLDEVRAKALGFRGAAQVNAGDPEGLQDLRSALTLSLNLGLSVSSYVNYANLIVDLTYQDPLEALQLAEQALTFVRARGMAKGEPTIRMMSLEARFYLGDWDGVSKGADEAIAYFAPQGNRWGTLTASYYKAWVLMLRGAITQAAGFAEALADEARQMGMATEFAMARVHGRRASGDVPGAERMLEEAIEAAVASATLSPGLVCEAPREAIALGRADLLARCDGLSKGQLAIARNAQLAWEALSAEATGRSEEALELFKQAERAWARFGNLYERGQAALGQGRCLMALRRPGAQGPAERARRAFTSVGAQPAAAEAEELTPHGSRLARAGDTGSE